jgi:hypothetical protein
MTMQNVREVVAAPTRTPHRYGLFSVVNFDPSDRAGILLAWDSFGCSALQVVENECTIPSGVESPLVGNIDCANGGTVTGFTVMAFDDTSLGRDRNLEPDRARQRLALGEQVAVEQYVTAIPEVAGTDVTDTVPVGSDQEWATKAALGAVDTAVSEAGDEGLILVRRSLITMIPDAFIQTGSMLRTRTGTPVAACVGWGATGNNRIIGLTAVVARRGPVSIVNAHNMAINDHSMAAERDYSIGWECGTVYADPTIGV